MTRMSHLPRVEPALRARAVLGDGEGDLGAVEEADDTGGADPARASAGGGRQAPALAAGRRLEVARCYNETAGAGEQLDALHGTPSDE
jgi:hypothetical protein